MQELTLVFIHDDQKILLGQKKRGFGQGHWNGFGGKIQTGESVEEAAKRELREESGLTATQLEKRGELFFEFDHDLNLKLHIHVFKILDYTGEVTESEEMLPRWFDLDAIPYADMWVDDPHWLPVFLEGKQFIGRFVFRDLQTVRLAGIEPATFGFGGQRSVH